MKLKNAVKERPPIGKLHKHKVLNGPLLAYLDSDASRAQRKASRHVNLIFC